MGGESEPGRRETGLENCRPIRVLYVVGTLGRGGAESLVRTWCEFLHGHGFSCRVLCLIGKSGPHVAPLEQMGVPVEELPQDRYGAWTFLRRFSRIVRSSGADIVHTQCCWSLPQQTLGATWGGSRSFVLTVHSAYRPRGVVARFRWLAGMRLASRRIACVVAVSRHVRDYVGREMGMPEDRVRVILNGVRLERFAAAESPRQARAQAGIPLRGLVAVSVASLTPHKGQSLLIEALARARARGLDVGLALVGEGPEREALTQLARDLGLSGQVLFLGARDDVPLILAASDLFVLASTREGFGLAVVEAQAAGLPVVAVNVGGIPEAMQDGRTGLLVSERAPQALAEAMETILRDPGRAAEMGRAGRRFVAERFAAEACARRYGDLYRSLAAAGRGMR